MRPKARGLAHHGGPSGWLEESDPARVILYLMNGPYRPHFPYLTARLSVPYRLPWQELLSCDLMEFTAAVIVNVRNHPSWATSRKQGMAWYSSRPMPSLWLSYLPARLHWLAGQYNPMPEPTIPASQGLKIWPQSIECSEYQKKWMVNSTPYSKHSDVFAG